MRRKKATILFEAFARILLMVIAIWAVFNIGKMIARAAGVGASDIEEEFNRFVREINELKVGDAAQVFVTLDPNTAIIGFSKDAKSYKCFNCGTQKKDISTFLKKPDNEQCNNKACICLCRSPLIIDKTVLITPYEMRCEKIKCQTLNENEDLAGTTELRKHFEELDRREPQKYTALMDARWESGFLLERHSRNDFVSNGLPSPQLRRLTIFIQKEQRGNTIFTTVCPGFECESQTKSTTETIFPGGGCGILRECSKGIRLFVDDCNDQAGRIRLRYIEQQNCEKVKSCVVEKTQYLGWKCTDDGFAFTLSYS